jgi:hypothetical protein
MAAFGPWRADRNCAVFMDARGAMITELALYRLMFQPPPSHAVCSRRRQDGKAVPVSTVAATDPAQMWPSILRITRQGARRNPRRIFHSGNLVLGAAGTE